MINIPARTPLQLGAAMRSHRKALGFTQQELADRIGVRQATISQMENGAADTRVSTLMEAIATLGLDLSLTPRPDPLDEILG